MQTSLVKLTFYPQPPKNKMSCKFVIARLKAQINKVKQDLNSPVFMPHDDNPEQKTQGCHYKHLMEEMREENCLHNLEIVQT